MSKAPTPQCLDAEEEVLGSILLNPTALFEASGTVTVDDFYHPAHSAIFAAMLALDATSRPVDSLTVWDWLTANGEHVKLRHLGDRAYLGDLQSKTVAVFNVAHHARRIRNKAMRRRWLLVGQGIVSDAYDSVDDEEFFANQERRILELTSRRRDGAAQHIRPVLRVLRSEVEKRWERRSDKGVTGVASGFDVVDRMTLGFQAADLVVIAARPSMGKTSFALASAASASEAAIPALVFSLEMSTASLGERLVSAEGGIDSQQLRSGMFGQNTFIQLERAFTRLVDRPIWFDDTAATLVEIRSRARRWRLNEAKDAEKAIVIVDYLQLMTVDQSRDDNRQREVSDLSRGLKLLAKELRCPVMVLSQLSRKCEERTDKRPMLSDLRESGAIEQDADVVAFVYRDEVYSKDECKPENKGVAEFIVAKQRNGPTGSVRLKWTDYCSRFDNLSARSA